MDKQFKGFAVGLGVLGFAVYSASCQTINQSGGSGTTYTDTHGDQIGSSNAARDLWSATIANDANNLYITINLNSSANINTAAFNYCIGITTGSPSAGGDTSADATTHGDPYHRAISIDSTFGGMTDWIGAFGAGGSGTVASPYTSYGFNDYVWNSGSSSWGTAIDTVASGQPNTTTSISLTVPMSDFANLALAPGVTFDFDIYSTGTSAGQSAYDSLADSSATVATATTQYNGIVLDQYTVTAVPEPTTLALAGLSGLSLLLFRRPRK